MEFGGNPGLQQPQRIIDRFVAERIDLGAGDRSSSQTVQSARFASS